MNCGHCAKGFSSNRLLRRHQKICFASNGQTVFFSDVTFYCTLCDELFYVRLLFVWHLQAHMKEGSISAFQKEHIIDTLYSIRYCSLDKVTNLEINKLRSSRKKTVHECKSCRIGFVDISAASLHHKLCHSVEQLSNNHIVSLFECDACNGNFDNLDLLEKHSCTRSLQREPAKHGTELPKVFSRIQVVIPRDKSSAEIGRISIGESDIYFRYLCHLCNMTALTPRMAHYHLLRHEPDHFVPCSTNVCPVCREDFSDRQNLSMHLHSSHSHPKEVEEGGNTDFPCEICGTVLKSYSFYVNHMLRVHNFIDDKSSGRPMCTQCNTHFRDKRGLTLHMKYHKCLSSGEKQSYADFESPLVCIYCRQGFPNGLTLGKHVKKKHGTFLKGKKYICCESDCQKVFVGYGNLARHYRSAHPLETTNECSLCQKSFDNPSEYFIHSLKHKLPRFHCPMCHKLINGPASCLRAHLNAFHFQGLRFYRKVLTSAIKWLQLRRRSPRKRIHTLIAQMIADNGLPQNMSPKSANLVDSTPIRSTSSNETEQQLNSSDSRLTSEASPLDSFSRFGTLKLGGVDLPVYQLTPGQVEQLQLVETGSLMGTSFTISQ